MEPNAPRSEQPAAAGPARPPYVSPWTFDLAAVTWKEYSAFRRGKLTDGEDHALMARVTGMSVDMIGSLSLLDVKRLYRDFFRKATEPLADPN